MEENKVWVTEKVQCDLCNHEWIAIHHMDSKRLECPNCENMAYYEIQS